MATLSLRETKSFDAEFKAVDSDAGTFEAIVSVFGNKDLGGDVVMPGAFADTLALWAAKGDPIPVIWSHDWDDPFAHIGYVVEARETEKGLWVKAQVDLDSPFAVQVHRLLKGRRVTQFSFGYFADEVKWVEDPDTGRMSRELHRVTVFEVGPTLLGMNPDTDLISAASATQPGPASPAPIPDEKSDSGATGDSHPTVDVERAQALLVRPMHEGISNE
jgi:HK97 family phage prohead protease